MYERFTLSAIALLLFIIFLAMLIAGHTIIHEQYIMCLHSGTKGC